MARKRPDVAWLPTPEGVVDAMLRLADVGPEDVGFALEVRLPMAGES